MKKSRLITLAVVLGLTVATSGFAFARSETTQTVARDQIYGNDYFAAANTVSISGTINGDVYVAANTITIDGTVNGDVIAAGNTITISGKVTGSVRAAGNNVSIGGEVDRNATIAGNAVDIGSKAEVKGNVIAAASTMNEAGSIDGDLTLAGSMLNLNGSIGHNVLLRTGQTTVADGAKVGGTLIYTSKIAATIASGATVTGGVTHHLPAPPKHHDFSLYSHIIGLIGLIFTGLVVTLLLPNFIKAAGEMLRARPWPSLGIGFIAAIAVPIAALTLAVTVAGLQLALIAFGLYFTAIVAAQIIAIALIGRLVGERTGWWSNEQLGFTLAAIVYWLVLLIPIAGGLIKLVVVIAAFGAFWKTLAARRQSL